jgi:TPR repeat protein
MYTVGHGVPQDYAEAVKWRPKAAEQGYTLAQLTLLGMYTYGWVASQDNVQATELGHGAWDRGVKYGTSQIRSIC